jgi:hypothetical protein
MADNFANLKQRNADLQRRYQELMSRHKNLKQRYGMSGAGQENALEAVEMKNRSLHIDRLIQKIQQVRAAISAKLKSRQ